MYTYTYMCVGNVGNLKLIRRYRNNSDCNRGVEKCRNIIPTGIF